MLEHEAPPPPPGRRASSRRPLLWAALAIVAAVALIAGLVAVAGDDSEGPDGQERAGSATTTDPAATSAPSSAPEATAPAGEGSAAELEAAVAELSAYVEQARGLRFRHPVEVELLDGDAFVDRLLVDLEEDRAEIERDERVLEALHLVPRDSSLYDDIRSLLGTGVVGFYDPETGDLVVRGSEITPYVRSTLVHELVHALDDQHFELDRPELEDVDDERDYAFAALYEGNARSIENEWVATLSREDRARAEQEEQRAGAGVSALDVPQYLINVLAFPYVYGEVLVERLQREGGDRRVDEAFSAPPVTTEQVLRPERYIAGEGPVAVEAPAADGPVIDEGAVGAWDLFLLLAGELGQQRAITAADGWGGDRYVVWEDGDGVCVRAAFVMDTLTDLSEAASALEAWADAHGNASLVGGDDRVTVTACG